MLTGAGRMGVRPAAEGMGSVLADWLHEARVPRTAGTYGPDSPAPVHASLSLELGVQLDKLGWVPSESQAVCGPQGDQPAVPQR